jgi:hypothetical protein
MNGRRIQGELLGVYGREIEFEDRGGGGRRIMRVPRTDIVRIEFLEDRYENQQDTGVVIPPRMRERNVTVSPTQPWTDTGIDVRNGQEIYFQTSGQVTWSPNKRVDANGTRNSKADTRRPLPGAGQWPALSWRQRRQPGGQHRRVLRGRLVLTASAGSAVRQAVFSGVFGGADSPV